MTKDEIREKAVEQASVVMMELWLVGQDDLEKMQKIADLMRIDVKPEELREVFWLASQALIEKRN